MGTSPGAAAVAAAPAGVKGSVFEPPFPIPESWEWTKLGEIGDTNIGLTYHPQDISDNGIPVLRSNNIQNGNLVLSSLVRVACHILPSQFIKNGDVLICARNGSKALVGKSVLVDSLVEPTSFGAFMAVFRSQFNPFIQLFLQSDEFKQYLNKSNSTTIHQLTQSMLKDAWMPFPPFPEQQRIVKRFEALSALCDAIDIQSVSLSVLAEQAKQKVLDLAIRGLLVSQNPTDEPASTLLDRIRSTADKPPCPKRTNETIEPPFPIPESWRWTTLGSVCELIAGVSYEKRDVVSSGIRILRGGNLDEEHRISFYDDDVFLPMQYIDKTKTVEKGDVVLVASTGSASVIGRAAIAPFSMTNVQIGAFLRIARSRMPELSEWIQILLTGERFRDHIRQSAKGTNIKNLKSNHFSLFLVPIPPLAEQRRIVAKVEELFSVIDAMATK